METKNIYQKLLEIQFNDIKLIKDTKGVHWASYATLSQIQETLKPMLQERKLVLIHSWENGNIKTTIYDTESWESISSEIPMNTNLEAQKKWSEISYFRRYNLLCLFDLWTDDDDWAKASPKNAQVYTMTQKDVEQWNGKIYAWKEVYVNWEKKSLWIEQIKKLESHEKYIPNDKK